MQPSSDVEANRDSVRRLFEDGFNHQRVDVLRQLVADDFVDAAGARGPAAFEQVIARLRAAFPDIHYTVEDVVAEGDKVAVRWHWSGTHRGSFRGVAPTQRSITNKGSATFQLRDRRIVAAALDTDRLGFLQDLGVVPSNDALFPAGASPVR
jgi:steroid delta-isomerase-like uncharacterized protein